MFILPLLLGYLLDLIFGDPERLPHPIVWFGKMISWGEHRLNRGQHRMAKGAVMSVAYILLVFFVLWGLIRLIPNAILWGVLNTIIIFYCLAGTTLICEVRNVFLALDESLEAGRKQVARIVGRDTSELTAQEVRTAALETLAENLSAYKMVNTLDSMIGYRTERYKDFGCWAARIDDIANYIPARLTAVLMVIASGKLSLLKFVWRNGRKHASPNSGYPEAALAGALDCRFGGPHYYFGELFDKPFIGENERDLTTADMLKAVRINRIAEVMMIALVIVVVGFFWIIA